MVSKSYLMILFAWVLCGCFPSQSEESLKENRPYEDVAGISESASFSFSSSLPTSKSLYPISTGRVFYVSNLGNDKNDGLSEDKPIRTLSAVNSLSLLPGDSVLFHRGDTFLGNLAFTSISGEANNPITFASYGEGKKPIITNGDTSKDKADVVSFQKCSNIVFRDIEIDVYSKGRSEAGTTCVNALCFRYSYVGEEKFENIYIVNNTVKGNGTDSNAMGIVIQSDESTFATSPSNVLTHAWIIGNEVSNIGRSGIHSGGWLYQQSGNQNEGNIQKYRDLHFDSNLVHDVGCIGIYPMDVTDATCNRNVIYNTGMASDGQAMEGECGIMALCAENVDILFNEIYYCHDQKTGYDAMGIDIDWNCNRINVQYNYCHDNQGPGIGTMANQNSFIRNNRVVNNLAETNQNGSICVCNFTSRYDAVNPDWHSVKNLLVENNFVDHSNPESNAFRSWMSNGDTDYEGDVFTENRVVYSGENPADFTWISIHDKTPWYSFSSNRYYADEIEVFKASDPSTYFEIDSAFAGGTALPYEPTEEYRFEEWARRDVGSSFNKRDPSAIPANPSSPKVEYVNGKLEFSWKEGEGDIWHYNIHKVKEGESLSYQNMIGEAYDPSFTYVPDIKDTSYYVIQPESNQGTYGYALKVKVSL